MSMHPFTIIRGGQDEAQPKAPKPKKFAKFDNTRAEIEQMRARFYASRDKAIDKLRADGKL